MAATWRELILPGIFPYYVTGGITAAGGAWNASIVAEIATYGKHHLVAPGLGAYIAQATAKGDFAEVLTGRDRHELLRRRRQPAAVAPALPPGRDQVLAVT